MRQAYPRITHGYPADLASLLAKLLVFVRQKCIDFTPAQTVTKASPTSFKSAHVVGGVPDTDPAASPPFSARPRGAPVPVFPDTLFHPVICVKTSGMP